MYYYGINYCKLSLQMTKLRVKSWQTGGKFVIINSVLIFVQDSPALGSSN